MIEVARTTLKALAFYAIAVCALYLGGPLGTPALASGACPSSYPAGEVFAIVRPPAFNEFNKFMASTDVDGTMKFIEVIRGKLASPADWPATLILCISDQTFCTTTLVGPRIFLTAAHCFDHVRAATIRGSVQMPAAVPIAASCTIHPEYVSMGPATPGSTEMLRPWSADIAVCATQANVPIPLAERLVSATPQPSAGTLITLLGFGCSSPGGGGVVQVLYAGPTSIKDVGTSTYFIHTKRSPLGPAALCRGDSGGASFTSANPVRAINGINAAADNNEESWITDLSRNEIRQFVSQQTADPERHVCGLHADAKGCRPQ